ncbi:MAG: beta-N-acetylglucosaminidase domain-containing protein [Rikenellaceae bacterium]
MKKFKSLCSVLSGIALATLASCASAPKPIQINPTPHSLEQTSQEMISTSKGYTQVGSDAKILDALAFANGGDGALKVTVTFGEEQSKEAGVEQIDGAYSLTTSADGVKIIGYNERGAFYGIQTLKQLEQDGKIPTVKINDYPDIEHRGVVEGFYGTPWSHEVRKSLIEYYGKYKMNSYLYGPKDDHYHSSPNWREPYPTEEAAKLKELVDMSNANRVDFVWAIHPGQDIQWTEEDYQKLLAKFESMYDLGVRSFALFFDDISGIGTRAVKQAELLNRLHNEFVTVKGDVKPLVMCPTDYTKLWADPSEDGYLSILGDQLDPSIHVMWTGDAICCDITDGTLEWVNSRINRPTYIWWNYPVTDYVKHIIMQGPVYGNSQKATKEDMSGFVSNPMEHGEASKIALFGVADYTWNIEDYKPLENWEKAIVDLMPEAADAYRTFAINSTDTETGYRRDESWEVATFSIDNYTKGQYDSLYTEFKKVKAAPKTIFEKGKNQLLIGELKPWLIEFEKLGERGLVAMDLIKLYEKGDQEKFWNLFNTTVMTQKELKDYKDHRSGTLKLTPFINNARRDLASAFYGQLSGKPVYQIKPMASFANISSTELSNLMLDGNSRTYYHSAEAQRRGSFVALDLGTPTEINHIYIEQGRNNRDDVDYFDSAKLEVSLDGKEWTVLLDNMSQQYVIDWKGSSVKAQYVRLSRLDDSKRQNWMSVRRFEINPTVSEPSFTTNLDQLAGRGLTIEGNRIAVSSILEVISVQPGGYFGIELPIVTAIGNTSFDLGDPALVVEFSADGENWSAEASSAKYIRYTNRTSSSVDARLKEFAFDAISSSSAGLSNALDGDITTSYASNGSTVLAVGDGAKEVIILSDCGSEKTATLTVKDAQGGVLSTSTISTGVSTSSLAQGSSIIEIGGDLIISEIIFK